MSNLRTPQLSPRALEEFQNATQQISPPVSAERLWERHLSPQDRQRLGGDLATAFCSNGGTIGMWIRLRGVAFPRAVVEIATLLGFLDHGNAVWLLREIGEFANAEEAMEAAIDAGDFVIADCPREAYWNGRKIKIDWDRQNRSWEFLSTLARCSKAGTPIDSCSFGESGDVDVVTKLKSRLTGMKTFPVKLADSIKVVGRGSQQLTLPRERIRIFERNGGDVIKEWTP